MPISDLNSPPEHEALLFHEGATQCDTLQPLETKLWTTGLGKPKFSRLVRHAWDTVDLYSIPGS